MVTSSANRAAHTEEELAKAMSSNATSNSSEGKKVNCRYARENPTILTSVIREEDVESDDNYENEETSDSEDDDDDNVVYIDDDDKWRWPDKSTHILVQLRQLLDTRTSSTPKPGRRWCIY